MILIVKISKEISVLSALLGISPVMGNVKLSVLSAKLLIDQMVFVQLAIQVMNSVEEPALSRLAKTLIAKDMISKIKVIVSNAMVVS